MNGDIVFDSKNVLTMKLLHYFITEKNYNPIINQVKKYVKQKLHLHQ